MKKIPWWFTSIGEQEKEQVIEAFDNRRFSLGKVTEELEKQFAAMLGVPYAVATTSGTAALTMALMSIGIEPGDEVIIPDLGWIATANAAAILGAKVVLVDCLPDSPLIDPKAVEKKITKKTKAIIPVHLNGRACQIEELKKFNIPIIEDACKAMVSKHKGKCLGTFGQLGCYSLGMVSLISIGYGGMVATSDQKLYEKLILIRNQGVESYENEQYLAKSFNFKISDISAAIGLGQLSRLDQKIEHINKIYRTYKVGIKDLSFIEMIPVDLDNGEKSLLIEVRSKNKKKVMDYLVDNGVEPLNFHIPLHKAPYLNNEGVFPNATSYADESFILPCGPSQPLENIEAVVEILKKCQIN
jgi:dTDP-4-amino-4,6-dideoxygalactose transaminase